MEKIKIHLVKLGNLKFPVSFSYIENWASDLMAISRHSEVGARPDADGENWIYTDSQLQQLVHHDSQTDITVAIINAPLENNFYLRRISNNRTVMSLFETADILRLNNLSVDRFILKNLYEILLVFHENQKSIPPSVYSVAHHETRQCLFDMCADKFDIIFSTAHPIICDSCKARLKSKQIATGLVETLEKELKRIRQPLFFRLLDFVKERPITSLAIAAISGLMLNILGNIIFSFGKSFFT